MADKRHDIHEQKGLQILYSILNLIYFINLYILRCRRSCLQHQSCKTGMLGDKTKYRLVDALALARKGIVRERWGLVPHGHFDA